MDSSQLTLGNSVLLALGTLEWKANLISFCLFFLRLKGVPAWGMWV